MVHDFAVFVKGLITIINVIEYSGSHHTRNMMSASTRLMATDMMRMAGERVSMMGVHGLARRERRRA